MVKIALYNKLIVIDNGTVEIFIPHHSIDYIEKRNNTVIIHFANKYVELKSDDGKLYKNIISLIDPSIKFRYDSKL